MKNPTFSLVLTTCLDCQRGIKDMCPVENYLNSTQHILLRRDRGSTNLVDLRDTNPETLAKLPEIYKNVQRLKVMCKHSPTHK
ncbi:MAG: hypothetical protein J6W40_00275 [Alphaproteobacteria bacterium]|nr:hypothetical protein [Alphaproteobacteria bacterium]